ncbi:MAG: LysR family transcriptional regulator [Oscillospiraceae bacterium]|nr:LysR family transcriptional regulator [Oscillospiraceae bacterium]
MTLKHLKIFTEVCRFGSITAAAKSMGMTQPAVSAAIKELEKSYNIRLFDRMNNRLYITAAGKQMLVHIEEINRQLSELKDIADSTRGDRKLRIGVDVILGMYQLPELLDRIGMDEMSLKTEFFILTPSLLSRKLLNNELDLVLSSGFDSSMFTVSELGSSPLCLMGGSLNNSPFSDQLSPEDLKIERLLLLETESPIYESFCRSIMEKADVNSGFIRSITPEPLIKAAVDGQGIIVLPRLMADYLILSGKKLKILETEGISAQLHFYSATHKQKDPDPYVERIIEMTRAILSRT